MAIVFPNNTISEVSPGFTYPGNMVQTVETVLTNSLAFNNWATKNNLGTASITPTNANNKILIYISTTFRQDSTQGKKRYGFSAQDVLAAEGDDPVIVSADNPDKLQMTSEYLIPVLVNAVKELSAEVETLKSRVSVLETK